MIARQLLSFIATGFLSGGLLITSLGANTLDKPDTNGAKGTTNPSAHIVNLPPGSDPASIRFEKAKVKGKGDPSFELTYSYDGQPLASDEHADRHFTFQVYFRSDELTPEVRNALSTGKMNRAEKAAYFKVTARQEPAKRNVIDRAQSKFCDGRYVDGSWIHTDPSCLDDVVYQTVTVPSDYITILVEPVPGRSKSADNTSTR